MVLSEWSPLLLVVLLSLLQLLSTLCQCQVLLLERVGARQEGATAATTIVQGLRDWGFSGSIYPYGHRDYERYRRVKNGACNVLFPLVVIRPASQRDVAVGVKVARAVDIDISVRSGGHGYTCNSIKNGSLHFDLRRLNKVELVKEPYAKVGLR